MPLHHAAEVAEIVRADERLRKVGFGDDDAAAFLRLGDDLASTVNDGGIIQSFFGSVKVLLTT